MTDTRLEKALRHDRHAILAALAVLTALAWGYVLWLAGRMTMPGPTMPGPAMPGMDMGAAIAPQIRSWVAADLLVGFVMWVVMMAAMMLPSATPMILLYARVGRQAEMQHRPIAATGWFAGGYLLAWAVFSFLAIALQAGLSRAALLTPMLASSSAVMGGLILIAAGAYQWSSWKERCLANCRAPLLLIQRFGGFNRRAAGSLGLGFRHGLYCVGCCWVLMLLLFVGGVMNVVWIAGLAIVVLLEKALSEGRNVSRLFGLILILAGTALALGILPPPA